MRLDEVRVQRVHLENPKTLGWQRPFGMPNTIAENIGGNTIAFSLRGVEERVFDQMIKSLKELEVHSSQRIPLLKEGNFQ